MIAGIIKFGERAKIGWDTVIKILPGSETPENDDL
jgi:hypothetical protein